jgi:hypothetical protein
VTAKNRDPRFYRDLKLGNQYERKVRSVLQEAGYGVVPLYETQSASAPKLLYRTRYIIIPDLLVSTGAGECFFVEVKFKRSVSMRDGTAQTCLSIVKAKQYAQVSRETGIPVYVAFVHGNLYPLRTDDFSDMRLVPLQSCFPGGAHFDHEYTGPKANDPGGNYYVKLDNMEVFAQWDPMLEANI